MIYWFRRKIIQLGKLAPIFLVLVVLISYIENENSLYYDIYTYDTDNNAFLNQKISYFLGNYLRYDILTIIILYALSFGLEMCWRNKLCIHYLTLNLVTRDILESCVFDIYILHLVFTLNIIVCTAIITTNIIGYIKQKKYE